MAKQRLHYFDILKGIAIFMVVMGHILTMCVRELDRAAIFKFIGEIHMPLFFFISGWFTFKLLPSGSLKVPDLRSRAMQLLIPMVVVSSIWIFYFPHSGLQSPLDSTFNGLWSSTWKNGYWFTFVLFQIMVIYAVVTPLFSRIKTAIASVSAVIVIWAAMLIGQSYIPDTVLGYGSLDLTFQFWPVFMIGVLASRHAPSFNRMTENSWIYTTALIIGGLLLYFISWPWEFPMLYSLNWPISVARTLFHISIAIVAIAVIRPWSQKIYSDGNTIGFGRKAADMWQLFGRKSLSIYLLHYFFLFPLGVCRPALESMGLGFTPMLFFAGICAFAVIAVVLGAEALIVRSPLLSRLLIGAR